MYEGTRVIEFIETESRTVAAGTRGRRKWGSCCLMGLEFQFAKRKESWRLVVQHECT